MNINEFIRQYDLKFADYLGDGLYVGYQHELGTVFLFTERENGVHWVGLDGQVWDALKHYGVRVQEAMKEANECINTNA